MSLSDIDEVVLIGGATRLQIFRDFFIRLFRKFPDTSIHPDEAVALGAAVQAAMKERKKEVKEMITRFLDTEQHNLDEMKKYL